MVLTTTTIFSFNHYTAMIFPGIMIFLLVLGDTFVTSTTADMYNKYFYVVPGIQTFMDPTITSSTTMSFSFTFYLTMMSSKADVQIRYIRLTDIVEASFYY